MPISREEAIAVYREILGRQPESEAVIQRQMAAADSVLQLAKTAAYSPEFAVRIGAPLRDDHRSVGRDGQRYELIRPSAAYAPWLSDDLFQKTYEGISKNTLVDSYRCWNLWQLIPQAAKSCHGGEHFIEIGVWRGGTGMLMARRMAMLGIQQPIRLCDTFTGVVKAGQHDPHYKGGEHADTSIAAVRELADKLSIINYEIIVGVFPDEAPPALTAGPVAFCHIDVDAYDSAKDCFSSVWPRLTLGGIVVFDDYGASTTAGVTKFVEELSERPDLSFQYNLNGHATIVRIRA